MGCAYKEIRLLKSGRRLTDKISPVFFFLRAKLQHKGKIRVFQQTSHAWPLQTCQWRKICQDQRVFCSKGRMNSLADVKTEVMKSHFPKLYCSSCHCEKIYLLIFRALKVSEG
ncbi:hypothetical protein GDO78_007079 [Eleutherodactylus coqui]|uniref:Uncharacterized protein n=1 Tax=Eleutherodactylus coqui TaxID=57060 RepID=A0A8J6FF22_ELECQ|nr:hypothetical protein GDO78_007079 [Eleutherodactylus coqui]